MTTLARISPFLVLALAQLGCNQATPPTPAPTTEAKQHETAKPAMEMPPNNLLASITADQMGDLQWMNPPKAFNVEKGVLKVTVDKQTDFFNNPEDLSIAATAPVLFKEVKGDFVAKALIQPTFSAQWNAVALMVYLDKNNWIKFAFENSDATGKSIVTVVTKGVSDDANGALLTNQDQVWLKLIRKGNIYSMLWSLDGKDFKMARLTSMPAADAVKIGVEAQSPVGDPVTHAIHYFGVEQTTVKDLRKGE